MSGNEARINYYRQRCVSLMNIIEQESGKLMSELAPKIEANVWHYSDNKDLHKLRATYRELCFMHDELTMD